MEMMSFKKNINSPKYSWLAIIIINLVIVLMMDIAAGIAYKKINGYSWYYVWQYGVNKRSIKTLYRTKSYKYHHDLFKNVTSKNNARWRESVYSVITNSLGFRDRTNRQIPLQSEKKRLVFIGDSFTEGQGLNYEKTFVGLIDNALKKISFLMRE